MRCGECGKQMHRQNVKGDRFSYKQYTGVKLLVSCFLYKCECGNMGLTSQDCVSIDAAIKESLQMDTESSYWLHKKKRNSRISGVMIREVFQERHKEMGWGDFTRNISGIYSNPELQSKWEEFYNGFRQGEDA